MNPLSITSPLMQEREHECCSTADEQGNSSDD